MAFLVVVLILAFTFVGCNGKLKPEYKSGFFTVAVILVVLCALLGFLFG